MVRWSTAGLAVSILLVVSSCATIRALRPIPEWVLNPPDSTDRYEYFVASGSDRTGDPSAAEQRAAGELLTRIHQALGVDVSVLITADGRATLDSYEASVRQEVIQSGGGRVEGFRIADRYVVEDGERVTVHLLGEYERAAFIAERNARRALVAEREALLLEPEREADAAAGAGRTAAAFQGYLQAAAAAAAAEDGLRIAPVVLDRSLRKTSSLIDGMLLQAVSGPVQVTTGQRPVDPVRFRLSDSHGAPVHGMPLQISYTEVANQRSAVRRVTLITDADGIVDFAYPRVEAVGMIQVSARIDTSSYLPLLRALPDTASPQRSSIERVLAATRASWEFTAVSLAREVATTILIGETDASGAPISSNRTMEGVAQALGDAGFRLVANGIDPVSQNGRPMAEVIRHLQMTLPGEIRRVVLGVATIADFAPGDGYLVKVSATVTVIDINTEEILYTTSAIKNARSSNAEQALNMAFLQLGRTIGEELSARLP